jgi:hypothetical protein
VSQRTERILHVVEDTEEEHHVERADQLGRQVVQVTVEVLDLGVLAPARSAANEKKPSLAPMSSTDLPANDGNSSAFSLPGESSTPGVTIPLPRSMR